ncbi:MAG TPA: hypothetical protein DF383_02785 [Deltaproteobacteria bacterium]|nr:hypothetical protein [Deltaproteobacteria bacterium]
MKRILFAFFLIFLLGGASTLAAQETPPPEYPDQPYPPPGPKFGEPHESGWFMGSDQGVLLFVGNSSNFFNAQYYGTIFGGYNFKGIVAPMLRIGQAFGSTNELFDVGTFIFILEGGLRVTPLRSKFRPYFLGTAGFYVLDFNDFDFPVADGLDFTFSAGGGFEYQLGASRIGLGSVYRGFVNPRTDLRSVEITLGYTFQF